MAATVGVVFRLTEFAVRNFKRIENSVNKTAQASEKSAGSVKKFDGALTALAGGAAIGLALAAKSAANLEDVLARLETVTRSTSQSMQTSLANAEASARKFSTEWSASAAEVIDAQFQLATAGIAVEEQLAGVQGAFKLAEATVGDFTQTTALLGQFLNTFGQNVKLGYLSPMAKVQRITDILTQTVQRFQSTLPVLAQGFKFIIGPARQLNLQLEEVSVALGILNTAGFRGTLAGTALSNTFNKVQRAVDKLDLDPSKFQDVEGNLVSLAAFFEEVNKALENTSPLEGQIKLIEVFDIRAGRVIKTLSDSHEALARLSNEFDIARGSTERLAKTVQSTTSKELKKLSNTFQNISTSIGKTINEGLKPFIAALVSVLKPIADFIEKHRTLVTVMIVTVTLIGAAGVAMLAYMAIASQVTKAMVLFRGVSTAVAVSQGAIAAASGTAAVGVGGLGAAAGVAAVPTWSFAAALAAVIKSLALLSVVAIAVVAIVAIGVALWNAVTASDSATDSVQQQAMALAQLEARYTDSASAARNMAGELQRLGKITRIGGGTISPTDFLGDTQLARNAVDWWVAGLYKSLEEALIGEAKILGEKAIFADVANIILNGDGSKAAQAAAKSLGEQLRMATANIRIFDPTSVKRSAQELGSEAALSYAKAVEIGLRSLTADVGGTVEVFQDLEKQIERIKALSNSGEAFTPVIPDFGLRSAHPRDEKELERGDRFVDNVIKKMTVLRTIDAFGPFIKQLQEAGFFADATDEEIGVLQANMKKGFGPGVEAIKGIVGVVEDLSSKSRMLGKEGTVLQQNYELWTKTLLRNRTSLKRIGTLNEQLTEGLKDQSEVLPKLSKEMAKLQDQREIFVKLSPQIAAAVKKEIEAIEAFGGTAAKALKDELKEALSVDSKTNKIDISLNKQTIQNDLATAFTSLTGIGLGDPIKESIDQIGGAVEGTIAEMLNGGISKADFGGKLKDKIREDLSGRVAKLIGQQFGSNFLGGALDKMKQFDLAVANELKTIKPQVDLLQSTGDLTGAAELVSTAMDKVAMSTLGIGLGIDQATDKVTDLQKQFAKIASSMITADSTSKALFSELQNILSQEPTTLIGFEKQLSELSSFIRESKDLNASGPLQQGTQAFESQFEKTQALKATAIETATAVASRATATVSTLDTVVKSVLTNVESAASRLGSILTSPFEGFLRGAEILQQTVAQSGSGAGTESTFGKAIEITSNNTFDINITGTNSGSGGANDFLGEDEIKTLIEEADKALTLELKGILQEMEERIREAR